MELMTSGFLDICLTYVISPQAEKVHKRLTKFKRSYCGKHSKKLCFVSNISKSLFTPTEIYSLQKPCTLTHAL